MSDSNEQGATGREFVVGTVLTVLGVGMLGYGVGTRWWPAMVVGALLILAFGPMMAGARKHKAQAGPLKVEADFTAPPPRHGDEAEGEGASPTPPRR